MMNGIFLLLGSNLGNRFINLQSTKLQIAKSATIVNESQVYSSEPWGKRDQPEFLNQAIEVSSALPAVELLSFLQDVEVKSGRVKIEKWGSRIIDIDILFYGNEISSSEHLVLPHPGIEYRRFVLTPLEEIAGDLVHPVLNKTIRELLQECKDKLSVTPYYL